MKRRRMSRRRRMKIFIRLMSVVAVFCISIYSISIFFRVKNIEINGNASYDKDEIIEVINIEEGMSMFFFNKYESQRALQQEFAYVDTVSVKRKFPTTIEVNINLCEEYATFYYNQKHYLVDKKGKILSEIDVETSKRYTRIFGLDNESAVVGEYINSVDSKKTDIIFEIIEHFEENNRLDEITEINVSKVYDVRVKWDNKFEIYLGQMDDMTHKMKFLDEVLKKLTPSDVGVIDLSDKTYARFRPCEILASPYPESTSSEILEEIDEEILNEELEEDAKTEDESQHLVQKIEETDQDMKTEQEDDITIDTIN